MENENYLYEVKKSLITETELRFYQAVCDVLPEGYFAQPQINLASVINKNQTTGFNNELFRNIDIGIFEKDSYKPIALVEINDSTHEQPKRIERDKKVKRICEEAGIPLVTFWTKYGVNTDYIDKTIKEAIENSKNPTRIAHSAETTESKKENEQESKGGCYIATCVYGSYDCPEVWTLRRYRDKRLAKSFLGRLFIRIYYFTSPKLVKAFGARHWFRELWKNRLDKKVQKLMAQGYENTPYND